MQNNTFKSDRSYCCSGMFHLFYDTVYFLNSIHETQLMSRMQKPKGRSINHIFRFLWINSHFSFETPASFCPCIFKKRRKRTANGVYQTHATVRMSHCKKRTSNCDRKWYPCRVASSRELSLIGTANMLSKVIRLVL